MSTTRYGTKTEAAETIALHVRVFCRKHGRTPDLAIAEEIVSEYRGGHRGPWLQGVALIANPKTVARRARQDWDLVQA
ncbi:MAG: hypothetical protein QJR09_08080 [Micrococcus sp.]|nr:hypothetical protein [Micrococcus sp.]